MDLTYEDVERRGLELFGGCGPCRHSLQVKPGDTARWHRILAVAAGRPIRELWAAGRLTCSACGRPLDELRVQARGGNLFMSFDVVADWRAAVDARGGCG